MFFIRRLPTGEGLGAAAKVARKILDEAARALEFLKPIENLLFFQRWEPADLESGQNFEHLLFEELQALGSRPGQYQLPAEHADQVVFFLAFHAGPGLTFLVKRGRIRPEVGESPLALLFSCLLGDAAFSTELRERNIGICQTANCVLDSRVKTR